MLTPSSYIAALVEGGLTKTAAVKQTAALLGVTDIAVYYWLSGKRTPPPTVSFALECWVVMSDEQRQAVRAACELSTKS